MGYDLIDSVVFRLVYKGKCGLSEICKSENIRLFSFFEGKMLIKHLSLGAHTQGNDAFCFGRVIFFDNTKPKERQRFAIAHEIGHILLHKNVESPGDEHEREADYFAERLLYHLKGR